MIIDQLESLHTYTALHPGFANAIDFLQRPDLAGLPVGRYDIQGDAVFAIVAQDPARQKEETYLEVHDRYIDIQLVLNGFDEMGWRSRANCRHPAGPYDPERDIQFFTDTPDLWLPVTPSRLVVFFPEDAHLPLIGTGIIHKVVVKVAIA